MKYVDIMEIEDTGFMNCIGVFDNYRKAYGEAYLSLCSSCEIDDNDHYISLATYREGDSGMVIKLVDKKTGKIEKNVTILFYDEDEKIIHLQKEKQK